MDSGRCSSRAAIHGFPAVTILGCLSAALESATLLTFVPLFRALTGGASAPTGHPTLSNPPLALVLAALVALVLVKNAIGLLETFTIKRLEGIVTHRLRARILAATFVSSAGRADYSSRSDLVNIIASNSWKVGSALVFGFRMIAAGLIAIALLATMAVISAALTGLALLFLGLILVVVRAASRLADRVGRQVVDENRRFGERMVENLTSRQLIRSFSREAYELGRFEANSDQLRRRMLHLDLLWAIPGSMAEVATMLLLAVLVVIGSMLGTPMPILAAFLAMLYRLQGPARTLLECKLGIDGLVGAVDDVSDFLRRAEAAPFRDGARPASPLMRRIEFDNVSFPASPSCTPAACPRPAAGPGALKWEATLVWTSTFATCPTPSRSERGAAAPESCSATASGRSASSCADGPGLRR